MKIKPFKRKANFYETDQMGIIHHSNYIRWFEESRVDLMEQLGYGYEKAIERGIDFGVINVFCEYKSMIRFGDTVTINVSLAELTNMKMTLKYEVINAKSGEICTIGKTQHFFFDRSKQRPISLKKEMPDLFELFSSFVSN